MSAALILIAKEPSPGRVKTRLCPPCTPSQAAALARAALLDSIAVLSRTPAARRVLVFDGDGGERWCPRGFELIQQRGHGLAERLAAAFEDVGGPALLVGMDTPQLTSALLLSGLGALSRPGVDAVLGPALDGGYWSIGLRTPCAQAFAGVPMSVAETCDAQRDALRRCKLPTLELPALRDIDTIADARAVAKLAPWSRFAAALASIEEASTGLAA
jgi:uncharacterized protein